MPGMTREDFFENPPDRRVRENEELARIKDQLAGFSDALAQLREAKKIEISGWQNFLERLIPYRDLVMVAGALSAVIGVGLVCIPAAMVLAGVLLHCLSRMMAVSESGK